MSLLRRCQNYGAETAVPYAHLAMAPCSIQLRDCVKEQP